SSLMISTYMTPKSARRNRTSNISIPPVRGRAVPVLYERPPNPRMLRPTGAYLRGATTIPRRPSSLYQNAGRWESGLSSIGYPSNRGGSPRNIAHAVCAKLIHFMSGDGTIRCRSGTPLREWDRGGRDVCDV